MTRFFGKMRKLQIFVPHVSDLFLRDTCDVLISSKQYDSATEPEIYFYADRQSATDFRLDGLVNIVSRERTDYYLPLSVIERKT